jgi:hypothetical protein
MTKSMITRMPRACAASTNSEKSPIGAELRQHLGEVGHVVAAVPQRRGEERRQPEAVHAEPLQVVELLDQPAQVAAAVTVAVLERPDEDLVEDGTLCTSAGRGPPRRR